MVEVSIKSEWLDQAEREADELGELKNSITHGEGNIAGKLGELVFSDYVNGLLAPTRNYDVRVGNVTFDVKTKRCNVKPERYFNCTVAKYNTSQACDFYSFVRILNDNSKAWILGFISKKKFYKLARFFQKGEKDPDSIDGFSFKADCYNVKVYELVEFSENESVCFDQYLEKREVLFNPILI